MKKTFVEPDVEVLDLRIEDVLTSSTVYEGAIELPGMP